MCTICGHYAKNGKIKSTDIYDMLLKMGHRGPDSHGAYLDGKIIRVEELRGLKNDISAEPVALPWGIQG